MIEIIEPIAGQDRQILTAETAAECRDLVARITDDRPWAVDVETNAYGIFDPRFKIRLIQFGDMNSAYIFPLEARKGWPQARKLLSSLSFMLAHGGKYDFLTAEKVGLIADVNDVAGRYVDTMIMTHLLDPRGKEDGGLGQALKDVCVEYVDPDAKDSAVELKKHFKSLFGKSCTIERGFREVPLFDLTYLLYSGFDPILTALLFDVVEPLVKAQQS